MGVRLRSNIILRYDDGEFVSSCIDEFKIVVRKMNITLEEIKNIKFVLKENGYYVENLNIDGSHILELNGEMADMPCVESMHELVKEVHYKEDFLINLFYKLGYNYPKMSFYVVGTY